MQLYAYPIDRKQIQLHAKDVFGGLKERGEEPRLLPARLDMVKTMNIIVSKSLNSITGSILVDTNIIIVSNNPMSSWLETVSEALRPLGKLYYPSEREAASCIGEFDPDLILIDASSMEEDVAALVEQIHKQKKQIPIIVATTSPTWRRARAVIRAGAVDYVRRSFDKELIVEICREQLPKRPFCLDDP